MLFVWIWVWKSSRSENVASYIVSKPVQQLITKYCNYPMHVVGLEGSLSMEEQLNQKSFHLEMIQVVIRHGDRSPAMNIPNIDTKKYDFGCTFETRNPHHRQLFEDFRQVSSSFQLRDFVKGEKLSRSLVPSGKRCETGQLSQKGFLQNFELGRHMRAAYMDLIDDEMISRSLRVRSTGKSRCIQSAAAFLFGLLTKDTIIGEGLTINVSSDIWFREDDRGILYNCPTLMDRWVKYKQRKDYVAHAVKMEPFMQKYAQILRTSRSALPSVVFLTDAILTRYCHNHPLPCGPGGCVSQEMVAEGIDFASWALAENYTGIADMVTHPMLIHMARRMIEKAQRKSSPKFVLYSGHDSTLTPLMLNLGVHSHEEWSPYASRVIFELWRDQRTDNTKARYLERYYFRVLVNGKVVTSKMKFCSDALLKGELCPVTELISWLSSGTGIAGMVGRYNSLCSQ